MAHDLQVHGSKRFGCRADLCTVSRCRTRGESEDHTSEKVCKGSTLALKPRADITRSPKQGYQWTHKKDLYPPKNFKKINIYYSILTLDKLFSPPLYTLRYHKHFNTT